MRSTFKILFYINRQKTKADGRTVILCRITIDGKSTALTSSILHQCENALLAPEVGLRHTHLEARILQHLCRSLYVLLTRKNTAELRYIIIATF